MNNIYLIGIMGCGKSTAGKKAAGILKVPFFDIDHEVEEQEGIKIREIFASRGEAAFRELESQVLADISTRNGALVSTGGGIILMQKNVDRMKKTGKIIWIRRPVETILFNINVKNRPLIESDPQKLMRIYAERATFYQKYADAIVDNDKDLSEAAESIIRLYKEWS